MDKNEELQKWLNDDRYVQRKELELLWGIGRWGVISFLIDHKIKPLKCFYLGKKGSLAFYDLQKCQDARRFTAVGVQELGDCDNNDQLVSSLKLQSLWGLSRSGLGSYLRRHRFIKPIKKVYINGKRASYYYDRAECEHARPFINQPKQEVKSMEAIDNTITATKYQILSEAGADGFVWDKVTMKHKIMPVKNCCDERGNFVSLFKKDEAVSAILAYKNEQKQLLEKCLADKNLVTTKDLESIWNCKKSNVYNKIYELKIKPYIKIKLENGYLWHFYKKSDCIESKEVEQVKQNELPEIKPEPAETTPDIIPADTIDLFTMSELESELKNRGVELTAEVKAKINASDMPEMQHIATMLRGHAKTIAIRLSVLNEIAWQLREFGRNGKDEILDEIGKPRVLWLNNAERAVFEFLRGKTTYTSKSSIIDYLQKYHGLDARPGVWNAISVLRDMGCIDAKDGCFCINSDYVSTETMNKDVVSNRKTDPSAIDIGLDSGKPISDKIKESGWYTVGIISEMSGKSETWLRSNLPLEDCLIAYGNHRLIKVWRPKRIIKWLNDRNIFVQGWGAMAKRQKNGMRKYNPDFDKIAFDMASQNKSDIEISNQLDVTLETLNKYKKEIPSFANAINSGMSAYLSSITSLQPKTEIISDNGISINQDLKDKLRFMAMADNVGLAAKLESIIMGAWVIGNYENK